uniref:Lipase_3 domain-containing protein n=1 Tax=Panagrellus redivivus TaxID=6233 RepID=A0A7E4W356_PANRE
MQLPRVLAVVLLICRFFVDSRAPPKYTDEFARRKVWPLCAESSTNSTRCLGLCYNKYEFAENVVANCDLEPNGPDTCAGSTFVIIDEEAIVLSFRGSYGSHQVTEENGSLGDKVPFPGGGNVSHYFYNAFLSVWNRGMKDDFLRFKNKYPNYEVWVTGHSLGGVMADLGATHISALKFATPDKIKLLNFAGPHGGDQAWADRVPALVPWAYRVVHHWDYVPHIPDNPNWQYTHGGIEIWYNNTMALGDDYKECDAQESPDCSNSVPKKDWTWNDHGSYFEGGDSCKKWCVKTAATTPTSQ